MSNSNPDKWAAPFAALISGLWLKYDKQSGRRNLITVLVLSKALDCLLNIAFDRVYKEQT